MISLTYLYFILFKSEQSAPQYNLIMKNMAFGDIPSSVASDKLFHLSVK